MVGAGSSMVAVAVKASLVPMHAWLPRAYVDAGPAVTALFSGLLTKAGVYVLSGSTAWCSTATPWRPCCCCHGAADDGGRRARRGRARRRARHPRVPHGQPGRLPDPAARLWTVAGVTAGIVYLLQYIAVKGALFLAPGGRDAHRHRALAELGGMVRTRPAVAIGFLLPALALAGHPPDLRLRRQVPAVLAAFDAGALARRWRRRRREPVHPAVDGQDLERGVLGRTHRAGRPRARRDPGAIPVPAGGAGATSLPGHRDPVHAPRAPSRCRAGALVGVATVLLGLGAGG
jgi:multicomponent Na+:H+ antiporter subunit D